MSLTKSIRLNFLTIFPLFTNPYIAIKRIQMITSLSKHIYFDLPGMQVSYLNHGPPSYKCPFCNASMWYEERSQKPSRPVNPTFSLCYQDGKVLLPKLNEAPVWVRSSLFLVGSFNLSKVSNPSKLKS